MTSEEEKRYTILLVEDDKFMVRLYEARLATEGFDVRVAMNGDECLEKVGEIHPDIILLDLMLPLMNGFDVLKHLKADPNTAGIPVIVFSNRSDQQDIDRAKELGATDYLIKVSTPPEEVTKSIRRALKGMEGGSGRPDSYHLSIKWDEHDAKRMVEELKLPIEYKDGQCVSKVIFEAMPEHSHDEPWIIGHFIVSKKP